MKDIVLHTALLLPMIVVSFLTLHYIRFLSLGYYMLITMTAFVLAVYACKRLASAVTKNRFNKVRINRG
ncbi:hypothetical protein pEaSNUABM13_00276 [Erwinia phage pEa_SNUABM_13]|nr:hypothetical protein pEaSNUABM13_00276 [Erwinia phage pEa_SNUABM_13]